MAGKSHDLTARVILQGQVDNTFTQIGAQLENLGTQLLRTNRQIIDFGKESLSKYEDFETAMLAAKAAMRSTYSDSMETLESDWEKMNQSAMNIASRTKFTTLDVATAYTELTRSSYKYEDATELLNAAIDLAYAGDMDLANAVDYLIKIMNSADLESSSAADVVDYLVYGGNNAATSVEEMCEAMVRVGPSLRFYKGDMAAAITQLAALADNGMISAQAGTRLAAVILRLAAPTKTAAEAMDELGASWEDMGFESEQEFDDWAENSEEAIKELNELGFTVYDSEGNLKPILQIWEELDAVTAGMTEQRRNELLKKIFPTRNFQAANAILGDVNDELGLYNEMMTEAPGAAAEAAETMESGFGGLHRKVDAVVDAIQTKVGGVLAEDLTEPLTTVYDLLNVIYNMDEGSISAVTGFFETLIGGAGALVVAGTGVKIIGTAIGAIPGGQYLLAALGIGALATAAKRLYDAAQEDKLGDMTLSMSTFTETFTNIAGAYDGKYKDVEQYNNQISQLLENYTTLSTTFSQGLWDMFINGSGMSDDEWKESKQSAISALEGMDDAAKGVIEAEHDMVSGVVAVKAANDDTGLWAEIQGYIDAGYEKVLSDVEAKGIAVRKALLSGWEDGELTDEEAALIYSTLDDYNKTLASYAEYKNQGKLLATLHDAQNVSADTVEDFYKTIIEARDASIGLTDEEFWYELGLARAGGAPQDKIDAMFAERDAEIMAKNMEYGQDMFDIFKLAMLSNYGYTDFGEFIENEGWDAREFIKGFVDAVGADVLKEMASYDLESAMLYNQWVDINTFDRALSGTGARKGHVKKLRNEPDYVPLPDGSQVDVEVNPDTSQYDTWKSNVETTGVHIPVFMDLPSDGSPSLANPKGTNRKNGYAEGGRADAASIFGEAGPEWAIPEEHTSRTAELLRMAAAASGFTWGELLSARGGLNAGGGGPVTVVYSPTINANDVSGVREELIADKGRLEKWLREREMKEELVSYA